MPVVAKLKYLRIAPRKVRLVADLIRKKKVEEAQAILSFTTKRAVKPIFRLLKTAIADAGHNFQLDAANLYISKIFVDEGPKSKRWMPRGRGSVSEIQKKTSHITLVLDEIEKKPEKIKKKREIKKKPILLKTEKLKKEEKEEIKKAAPEKPKPEKKPKLKPEFEDKKPRLERAIRKIFRRKSF